MAGPRARRDREGPIHKAILAHLRVRLPGAVIHHSPNETDLSGPQAVRLVGKARCRGMLKGFPDLIVLWRGRVWGFECKAPGNRATLEQKAVGEAIHANGGRWAAVRSIEEVEERIAEWIAEEGDPGLRAIKSRRAADG
jgi:hypothetical protein